MCRLILENEGKKEAYININAMALQLEGDV